MVDVYEIFFILQFFVVIGITLAKIYNVMELGKLYSHKMAWILWISFVLAFGIGFFVYITDAALNQTLLYTPIILLESVFFLLQFVFLFAELMIAFKDLGVSKIESFKSLDWRMKNTPPRKSLGDFGDFK